MTAPLHRALMRSLAAFCLATTMLSSPLCAETLGPVTDDVGVLKVAKGQPILIGALLVLSDRICRSASMRPAARR